MSGARICTCRFCDKGDFTPQGIQSHERFCDENPNPGITYEQQEEMDLLDETEGADPPEHPNPDQSVSGSGGELPSVEKLSPDKNQPPTDMPATDGGEPSACPVCEHGEVIQASEAKESYVEAVEKPNPRAVLAYELADWNCQNPECAALWGEEYHEPLTMEQVVTA